MFSLFVYLQAVTLFISYFMFFKYICFIPLFFEKQLEASAQSTGAEAHQATTAMPRVHTTSPGDDNSFLFFVVAFSLESIHIVVYCLFV